MKKEIKMKKICLVLAMVLAIALFPVFANGEKEADASNGVANILSLIHI